MPNNAKAGNGLGVAISPYRLQAHGTPPARSDYSQCHDLTDVSVAAVTDGET